jgi:hypothetical protein
MNTFHKQKYFSHIRVPYTPANEEAKEARAKDKRALLMGTFKITGKMIHAY